MKKQPMSNEKVNCKCRLIMTVLLFITVAVMSSYSQNFSGLEGKSLTKVDDIASGLISLIGSGGLEGKINKVTVMADGERTLKLQVEYTGFPTAYMHAEVLASTKAVQNEVREGGLDLTGKTSPVSLELNLQDNLTEGFKLESAFLQIRISKNKTAVGGQLFLYAMDKSWQKEIKAENLVLQAELEPVGITSQLREGNKVVIMPVNKSLMVQKLNQPEMAKNTMTTTATRTPGTTATRTLKPATKTQTNTETITTATRKPVSTATRTLKPATKTQTTTVSKTQTTPQRMTSVSKATLTRPVVEKPSAVAATGTADDKKQSPPTTFRAIDNRLIIAGLALDKAETDQGARGPDNNPIPLFEDLTVTKDFEFPFEITNISMDVFPDKNPASGMFYYLPAAYILRWTVDDGYAFRILYGTASSENGGEVRMSATLSPDISKREVELIHKLLTSYVSRNPGMKYSKLRLIPIQENPTVSFPVDLNSQYEITADKVAVNITSSLREPFQVSWVTDNNTKDEMQVSLLEKTGIQGIMTLKPESDNIPEIKIPVVINLADNRTLGRIDLENKKWRTDQWKNQTPYPLKLKYLHMLLVKDQDGKSTPFIYSWSLNDLVVPVNASVKFDASKVPSWVDDADMAQRIWIEYAVVDCDECDRQIINTITGGTYGTNVKNVTFETFQLFDNVDAQFIQIKVRSKQGDPKGEKVVEFDPVRIYQDNEITEAGQLYVPLEEELSFDYFITVVMKNGNAYKANDWIRSGEQEIYLGLDALKNAIPGIPLKNDQ
jgi:hypothetical protein